MMKAPAAICDFETRSACSLKKSGAWRYSIDSTTEILCLAYRLPSWDEGRVEVWWPEALVSSGLCVTSPPLTPFLEMLDWIDDGGLVKAHNVWFEYCIWTNIMSARHGWPLIPLRQYRCSAAEAASHALPRALDDAGDALGLAIQKDATGHKAMMKTAKPRKSRKKERETWAKAGVPAPALLWHESLELWQTVVDYCKQDVLAEQALSDALSDLSPEETEIFLLDLEINARGFQLDGEAVTSALSLLKQEIPTLNQELETLTGGAVKKATERAKLKKWFTAEGLDLPDTQKDTVEGMLTSPYLHPKPKRALEILREIGRSSTAKYQAMKDWSSDDWRVYGGLLYHGASTGRWSGKGIQPHNFPKGTLKKEFGMDALWTVLKTEDRGQILQHQKTIMEALSNGLRGAIVATPGYELFVADYASIEARVVLWLAGDEDALDLFRTGADIYCEMASEIYGRPITKANKDERALGKIAILGLGYGMGVAKFETTCEKAGIDLDPGMAEMVVPTYRQKFYRVQQLWWDQEAAAIRAVDTGQAVECGRIAWYTLGRFLYAQLPSGRRLAYPDPEVRMRTTPWGATKPALTFKGVNPINHQWQRTHTYGGSLVENLVQAIARDLLAAAMVRCEGASYRVVLTIHDELICEHPAGDLHEFNALVEELPEWAGDCPVAAESWRGFRYKKG